MPLSVRRAPIFVQQASVNTADAVEPLAQHDFTQAGLGPNVLNGGLARCSPRILEDVGTEQLDIR